MYKKRGSYNNLEEYTKIKTGKNISELDTYKEYHIDRIDEIRDFLVKHGKKKGTVYLYSDYDADGITSTAILVNLLFKMGINVNVTVPHRFTDGYGINEKAIEKMSNNSVLITVDNGIAAIDAIKKAKEKGIFTIIMDHHLAPTDKDGNIIISDADIIVDPEALEGTSDFSDYCGAGLSYKLCERVFPYDEVFLNTMSTYAAIGTVADVVSLTEDNRRIVQKGLKNINKGNMPYGLKYIVNNLSKDNVYASDIAFRIAPCINASGRLYDNGASITTQTIINNSMSIINQAKMLVDNNNARKAIVNTLINNVKIDENDVFNFVEVKKEDINDLQVESLLGCMGLVAGNLTEKTGKPSFVYTDNNGIMKGSARTDDENINHVKKIMDNARDYFVGYGGHAGAAGFAFKPENRDIIYEILKKNIKSTENKNKYYDLEFILSNKSNNILDALNKLDRMEPLGKDFEEPVFKINVTNAEISTMGADKTHIRINLPFNTKAVGFRLAEKYKEMGSPKDISIYGRFAWNFFNGKRYQQFVIEDIEKTM